MGQALAQAAQNVEGTIGWCLKGVTGSLNKAFRAIYGDEWQGLSSPVGSAYLAADVLRGKTSGWEKFAEHFVEVDVERDELNSLPAGAIVVWDKSEGHEHGHISISLGNGQESSDHIQGQITDRDAEYTVFYPVG